MDYFTSGDFLGAAWKRRFAGFLLERTARLEGEYPLNREFMGWLYIVYQFTVNRSREFQMMEWARFDGQEFIFEIAKRAQAPKAPRGNELAISYSFREYLRMVYMAEHDAWSEQKIGQRSEIIGHYAAGYITDKCRQRGDMDYERHPAGLRLMTHFFRREGLPDELYRIVWKKLDLKTALMGRSKILYGPLRELALERLPELAGQRKVSFAKPRKDFSDYAVSTYKRRGEYAQATEEDIRRTDDFFSREDFQQALLGYLNQELPYLPEWSRSFLGVKGEETPESASVTLKLGKDKFTVQFHLRYQSFFRNGEPIHRLCLIWERLMEWAPNSDTFLRLLPVTAAVCNQYDEAREPEWARSLPPVSFLPYQIFAENTEVLYVCIWFQRDRVLALFQQTPYGQKLIEGGEFHEIEDAETAKDLVKRLLDDQLHPKGFPLEALEVLPESVYAK